MTSLITNSQLAARIRQARKQLGLSQASLAKAAGLDQSQVSRMESGKVSQPTVGDIASISMGLGIPRDALIDMTDQDFKALLSERPSSAQSDVPKLAAERYVELVEAFGGGVRAQEMIKDIERVLKLGQPVVIYCNDFDCAQYFGDLFLSLSALSGASISPELPLSPLGPADSDGLVVAAPDISSDATLPAQARGHSGPLLILASGSEEEFYEEVPSRALVSEMAELRSQGELRGPMVLVRLGLTDNEELRSLNVDQLIPAQSALAVLPIYYHLHGGLQPTTFPHRLSEIVEAYSGIGASATGSLPPGIHPMSDGYVPLGDMELQSALVSVGAEQGMFTDNLLVSGINHVRDEVLARAVYGATLEPGAVVAFSPNPDTTRLIAEMVLQDGRRADDLVVAPLNAADAVMSYNPLSVSSQEEVEDAAEMVRCFMVEFLNLSPETTPRALVYAHQAVWAMCEANLRGLSSHPELHLTLLQLPLFFTDRQFRHTVMEFCTNLAIREMFAPDGPFEAMDERQQFDHILPILRGMHMPSVRDSFGNVFGQSEDRLKLAERIQQGKIVLLVGDSLMGDPLASSALGLFASQQVVMAAKRNKGAYPCTLVLDEAGPIMNDTVRSVLPHSRRAGLRVVLSDDAAESFKEQDLELIRRSTQSFLSCRLDALSAETISGLISAGGKDPSASQLAGLDEDEVWANLSADGSARSGPFRFRLPASVMNDIPNGFRDRSMMDIMAAGCLETTTAASAAWEARSNHMRSAIAILHKQIDDRVLAHAKASAKDPWESWEWGWDS